MIDRIVQIDAALLDEYDFIQNRLYIRDKMGGNDNGSVGIVVVDDLSRLNEAAESVSFVLAGEDGVKIDITRPEGPTAFCKIVVRDEGRE